MPSFSIKLGNPAPDIKTPEVMAGDTPKVVGLVTPLAGASQMTRNYAALLEQRPPPQALGDKLSGAQLLAGGAVPKPGLTSKTLSGVVGQPDLRDFCRANARGFKGGEKLAELLVGITHRLGETCLDGMSNGEAVEFLDSLIQDLEQAVKRCSPKKKNAAGQELLAELCRQKSAAMALKSQIQRAGTDIGEFVRRQQEALGNSPMLANLGDDLERFWDRRGDINKDDFATLSLQEQTDRLAKEMDALTQLAKTVKPYLDSGFTRAERQAAQGLYDAILARQQALGGVAQDLTRVHEETLRELAAFKGGGENSAASLDALEKEFVGMGLAKPDFSGLRNRIDRLLAPNALAGMSAADQKTALEGIAAEFSSIVSGGYHQIRTNPGFDDEDKARMLPALHSCAKAVQAHLHRPLFQARQNADTVANDIKINAGHLIQGRGRGLPVEAHLAVVRSKLPIESFGFDDALDLFVDQRQKLGNGQFNTVFEVQWKSPDGKITEPRVLKADIPAALGAEAATAGLAIHVLDDGHGVAGRNLATAVVARELGMEEALPMPNLVMHRGELNIAMVKAPGFTIEKFVLGGQFKKTPEKFKANLAEELCRLEWLDALCGQTDRHFGNYLVEMKENDGVVLHPIDNDMSFGSQHPSPGELLKATLTYDADSGNYVNTETLIDINKNLSGDPNDPGSLRRAGYRNAQLTRCHSIGLPSLVDRKTYDWLMRAKETLAADGDPLAGIGQYLSNEAKQQTESRLRKLIEQADFLNERGLVIENGEWDQWKSPRIGPPPDDGNHGDVNTSRPTDVPGGLGVLDYLRQCGGMSYFLRDTEELLPYYAGTA